MERAARDEGPRPGQETDHENRPSSPEDRGKNRARGLLDLPLGTSGPAGEAAEEPARESGPSPSPVRFSAAARRRRWILPLAALVLVLAGVAGGLLWPRGAPPVARFAPTLFDFGEQRVGTAGEPAELVITNGGDRPLEVTAVDLAGPAAADFTLAGEDCRGRRLDGGGSCTAAVSFAPGSGGEAGRRSATLELRGAFANSPASVPLLGTAVAPVAVPERRRIDFAAVPVGADLVEATAIANRGTAPLELSSLRLLGGGAEAFQLRADFCSGRKVGPGERCALEIAFEPRATGVASAVLEAGETGGGGTRIELRGEGLPPRALLAASAEGLDFGAGRIGEATGRELQITNPGLLPARVEAVEVEAVEVEAVEVETAASGAPSEAPIGGFRVGREACTGKTLAPAEACELTVEFSPEAEGAAAAVLVVRYRGEGPALAGSPTAGSDEKAGAEAAEAAASELRVPLGGAGVIARLAFSSPRLDLGRTRVGSSERRELELESRGSAAAAVGALTLSGPDAAAFQLRTDDCSNRALEPRAQCALEVAFRPRREGAHRAELVAAAGAARAVVPLLGVGEAPRLAVRPERLDWGRTETGDTARRELTLTNPGSAPLNLSRLTVDGDAAFRLTGGTCGTGDRRLRPTESCGVVLVFAPTGPGARTASLAIDHDGLSGPRRIALEAVAIPPAPRELRLTPGSLTFADQPLGGRSGIETVTITNPGGTRVELHRISLGGADAGDFQIVPGSCEGIPFLAPGGSCTVGIRFVAAGEGSRRARLVIESAATVGHQVLELTARGLPGSPR